MGARFSTRTGWDVGESALAAAIRHERERGRELVDLTVSNPTRCGFTYDAEGILGALRNPEALVYDPDPKGMLSAREAVCRYYRDHAAEVEPDQVILTTSTSEAYSYLLRLLCNFGDEVLVAQPSYPLFDFLADLDDVRLRPYPLFYDFGWWIDWAALEAAITPKTRAMLLVHPNNPTGHATGRRERTRMEEFCLRHGLALVVDEVFLDYGLPGTQEPTESFALGPHPVLTFVVSGLSKISALPQMKAAWIATLGPQAERREALGRLEMVADTFLSMSAPVQLALPVWLEARQGMIAQIVARVSANLATLRRCAAFEVMQVEAGWCAVVRVPDRWPQDEFLLRLVKEFGVVVHPGSFYGMAERNRIVVSLLGPPEVFAVGVQRLALGCESN